MSVLDDIDVQIEQLDTALDPFNILGIVRMNVIGDINEILTIIDIDKLIIDTLEFDESKLYSIDIYDIVFSNSIMVSDEIREALIRLAWWICNQHLYIQCTRHIDMSDIAKTGISDASANIYTSRLLDDNIITIHISAQKIELFFKNTKNIC
jgi:hypothetical protein